MTREHARAVADIDVALEFRDLIAQVAGPGALNQMQLARDLFAQNHRTIERWYGGYNPIPRNVMAQLRSYVDAAKQLRTDIASVREDALADGLPEIVVALNLRSFAEGMNAEPIQRPETVHRVEQVYEEEAEFHAPGM